MSSCSRCRKMMVGALYQELTPRRQQTFDAHLASCPTCAGEYRQLSVTLKIMDQKRAPEVPPAFWQGFWARLSDRLEQIDKRPFRLDWRSWLPTMAPLRPALVPLAAALLLVATGIYIGRSIYFDRPAGEYPAASRAAVLNPAAVAEFNSLASRYLERSRVLLLGLGNFDTEYDDPAVIDFSQQQMMSQELLFQGRELRSHQLAASNQGLQSLIDEIELILLQLANSDESENLKWTIQLLQEGIDNNAILLRITLTELGPDGEGGPEEPGLPKVKGSALLI